MELIKTILISILSFSILIIIHEVGHLISARLFNIRVSEFSIGFGPRIISKKKNGILYKLSLFPIGGYVKMPEDLKEESSVGVPFSKTSLLPKITTLLAGSISNILLSYILVLAMFIFFENLEFSINLFNLPQNFIAANNFFIDLFKLLVESFTGLLNGTYSMSDIAGPIGITDIISKSFNNSAYNYLFVMSFITLNIGVFNSLPIPALDGARALFCIIEVFFKERFPIKTQEGIHTVGMLLLLGLIIIITLKDICNLIPIF